MIPATPSATPCSRQAAATDSTAWWKCSFSYCPWMPISAVRSLGPSRTMSMPFTAAMALARLHRLGRFDHHRHHRALFQHGGQFRCRDRGRSHSPRWGRRSIGARWAGTAAASTTASRFALRINMRDNDSHCSVVEDPGDHAGRRGKAPGPARRCPLRAHSHIASPPSPATWRCARDRRRPRRIRMPRRWREHRASARSAGPGTAPGRRRAMRPVMIPAHAHGSRLRTIVPSSSLTPLSM